MVGALAWVQSFDGCCCGGWHGAGVSVSGVASCRDRDDHRVVSAIAWYGGGNDDRLAWLSDCCSNTSEGGAGWVAVGPRKAGPCQ